MCTKYSLAILGAGLAFAQTDTATQALPSPAITVDATMSGALSVPSWLSAALSSVDIPGVDISWEGPPTAATPTSSSLPSNYCGPATTVTALPAAMYQAVLPASNFAAGFEAPLTGNITISSSPFQPDVEISIEFHGFPSVSEYGPFIYHIHAAPVPEDGNCTAALKHLDPTIRGEKPPCMATDPASCQVGDLSGKHGNITGPDYATNCIDHFLSTDPKSPAFFGDKSIVIHTNNATRITCANFVRVEAEGPKTGPTGTGTEPAASTAHGPVSSGTGASSAGQTSSMPVQSTNGAGAASLRGMSIAAGLFAMIP